MMLRVTFVFFCVLGAVVSSPTRLNDGGRIVGGHSINITKATYQMFLSITEGNNEFGCGGALIDKQIVLTAAHCVKNASPSDVKVRMGSTWTHHGGELVSVANLVWHHKYTSIEHDCDVALLKLDKLVEPNTMVSLIKLVEAGKRVKTGSKAVATGWGSTKENNGKLSYSLQAVTLPIISETDCRTFYEPGHKITDNMLCAGYPEGGKDPCQGDSGGPLTFNDELVGVISWGDGCARKKKPTVYADISALRPWIDENMTHLKSKSILRGHI